MTSVNLSSTPGGRIVRAPEVDVWQTAAQTLRKAEDLASSEKSRGYREGYEKGVRDGLASSDGLASMRDEHAAAAEQLARTVAAVDRYLGSMEGEIAELTMGIVRQVLGAFDDADLVARLAGQALANFRRAKHLKITVHPDACTRVREAVDGLVEREGLAVTVMVAGDPALRPTDCRLVSDFAVVEADLETQLAALARALPQREAPRP